jgi:hypothetical protein
MISMSRSRVVSELGLVATLVASLAGGCVHARDFRSPYERITPHSAYAEAARIRVDTDLLASDSQRFLVNLGLTVAAVRGRLDFSANLAQGSFGVVSVGSKFTVYDGRYYGLGGRVSLTYLNPRTFWFLPEDLRRKLGTFNLATVPLELWNSFPVTRWFGFHLGVGYRAVAIWGRYDENALLLDANLAQRSFAFEPVLDFFVARRVALRVRARLPVFAQLVERSAVEVEVEPGLIVGARSVEWVRRDFADTVRLEASAETRFGANTHLRLGVSVWAFRPLEVLTIMPSLGLYWRFR